MAHDEFSRHDALAAGRTDDIAQQRLPILERAAAQVVAIKVQHVEREVGEPLGTTFRDRLIQRVDVRHAALIGHGDLAVEHHRGQAGIGQGTEWFAEQRGVVAAIAAQQGQPVAGDDRDEAVPVVLDLVRPAIACGRRGAGRHDLQADLARQVDQGGRVGI